MRLHDILQRGAIQAAANQHAADRSKSAAVGCGEFRQYRAVPRQLHCRCACRLAIVMTGKMGVLQLHGIASHVPAVACNRKIHVSICSPCGEVDTERRIGERADVALGIGRIGTADRGVIRRAGQHARQEALTDGTAGNPVQAAAAEVRAAGVDVADDEFAIVVACAHAPCTARIHVKVLRRLGDFSALPAPP